MLKVHTNDGNTFRLDLNDERQAEEWLQKLKRSDFQKTITGVSVLQKCTGHFRCSSCKRSIHLTCSTCGQNANKVVCGTGIQYSLSKPVGFDDETFYLVEKVEQDSESKGGERVTCFVGDVRMSLMVHRCQSAARVSFARVGKQRFNPYGE